MGVCTGVIRIAFFIAIVNILQVDSLKTRKVNHKAKYGYKFHSLIIDGVNVNLLSQKELEGFLYAEDEKLWAEIDIWVGKQTLAERTKHRVKRVAPIVARLAWVAGKALFRSLSKKAPKLSRSSGKLTKQYQKNGNFGSTLRDFRSLKPNNIKTFRGPKGLKGVQGTIGRGRWTVKARSKSTRNGPPTLEIHRTNKFDRRVLRKIRYNQSRRKLP